MIGIVFRTLLFSTVLTFSCSAVHGELSNLLRDLDCISRCPCAVRYAHGQSPWFQSRENVDDDEDGVVLLKREAKSDDDDPNPLGIEVGRGAAELLMSYKRTALNKL